MRVERDARDEKLGKKIRDAQMEKIPYMFVIGAREVEDRTVSVRSRSEGDIGSRTWEALAEMLRGEFDPVDE